MNHFPRIPSTEADRTATATMGRQRFVERRSGHGRPLRRLLRPCVLWLDWLLRRYHGVHEFPSKGDNLLRISVRVAEQPMSFDDGTAIAPGESVIDLHLWNERMPALGSFCTGLGWGSRVKRRFESSLAELAAYLEVDPLLQQCKAIRADAVFLAGRQAATAARIAERLGFSAMPAQAANSGRAALAFALACACHPSHPMPRRLRANHYVFWMSCRTLQARHCRARPRNHPPPVSANSG